MNRPAAATGSRTQTGPGPDVLAARAELEHARIVYADGHAWSVARIAERITRELQGAPGAAAAEILGSAHVLRGLTGRRRGEPVHEDFASAVIAFTRVPGERWEQTGASAGDFGIALQETGQAARAVTVLDRALALGQDTPDVRRYRAAARRDRGDRDEAYTLLAEAVRRAPVDWQAWEWLAELTETVRSDSSAAARCWARAWRILDGDGRYREARRCREHVSAACSRAVGAAPDDPGVLMASGRILEEVGLVDEAADLLCRVANLATAVGERIEAARLLLEVGESHLAGDLAEDVLADEPGAEQATIILARALRRRRDVNSLARARQLLTELLRARRPGAVEAEVLLGEIRHADGSARAALGHFDTVLAAAGNMDDELAARLHYAKGQALRHLRDTATAITELGTAAALRPRDAEIRLALAGACREAGDLDGAIEQFKDVVDWTPGRGRREWVAAATGLGSALLRKGDRAKALTVLRQIPEPEARDVDVLRPFTDALLEDGREQEALSALRHAERSDPDDLDVRTFCARVLYQLRQLDAAAERWTAVLDADENRWRDRAWLGEVERLRGNPDEALRQLDRVLADHPDNPFSLSSRAAVLQRQDRPDEALADVEHALRGHPTDLFSLQVLRELLLRRKEYDVLVDRFRAAVRTAPAGAAVWREYGQTLRQVAAREPAAAPLREVERELVEALKDDPGDVVRLRALSALLLPQGRGREAVAWWAGAITTPAGESDARVRCEYGEVLRQAKRFQQAQEALDTALWLADDEEAPHVHHAMGRLLIDQNRYEEAVRNLDLAVRDPRDPAAWHDGTVARIVACRFTETEERLLGWLSAHPGDAEAWWLLGWLRYRIGAFARAAAAADTAVRYDPLDARKQELLGWTLLRVDTEPQRAGHAFDRVLETDPARTSSLQGKARALFRTGREDEARVLCGRLLAATANGDGQDASGHVLRAWCLARLGEPRKALAEYRSALASVDADRGPVEFAAALCQLQVADSVVPDLLEQALLNLDSADCPASGRDLLLRRRGILAEVLQDMDETADAAPALSGNERYARARRKVSEELALLPSPDEDGRAERNET